MSFNGVFILISLTVIILTSIALYRDWKIDHSSTPSAGEPDAVSARGTDEPEKLQRHEKRSPT